MSTTYFASTLLLIAMGVETKDFMFTLCYVKITTSDINFVLKNSRRGKSRSKKGY